MAIHSINKFCAIAAEVVTGSIVLFLLTGCALFGGTPSATETVRFVVKDQDGVAVSGAEVSMEWYRGESVSGLTDGGGVVTLTASGVSGLSAGVTKEGYYPAGGDIFSGGFTSLKGAETDGVRVHMNPLYMRGGMYLTRPPEEISIELKKIKEPVPMYVRRIERLLPALNEKIGFDFEVGDWVAPHGRGSRSDIVFEGGKRQVAWDDYDMQLVVSFEREADGIVEIMIPDDRKFRSHLLSPVDGPLEGYLDRLSFESHARPNTSWIVPDWENKIYLFRTRTESNQNGVVVSGGYGKIYNGIKCFPKRDSTILIVFDYYFNPSRKSRSLEYNGTNLFKKPETAKPIWRPGFPPPQESPVDPEIDHSFRP